MADFLSGMITAGSLVAALFFFRFWKRTRDSLFLVFGMSFLLFAFSQAATLLAEAPGDTLRWVYLLRLAGFVLLLAAIIGKNFDKPSAR